MPVIVGNDDKAVFATGGSAARRRDHVALADRSRRSLRPLPGEARGAERLLRRRRPPFTAG